MTRTRRFRKPGTKRSSLRKRSTWGKRKRYSSKLVRSSSRIPRALNAFPMRRFVRHTYVDNITLPAAGGAGSVRSFQFLANDMYDPNYTGVGHQPLYRDEMAFVYTKYTVISSFIKVTFNQGDTNQQNFGIIVGRDATLNSNATLIMEEYGGSRPTLPSQANGPITLSKSYNAKRFWKQKNINDILGDDIQRVDVGSSPGAGASVYFVIWSAPMDPAVVLSPSKIQVRITYVTCWHFPQDAVQS